MLSAGKYVKIVRYGKTCSGAERVKNTPRCHARLMRTKKCLKTSTRTNLKAKSVLYYC